MKEGYIMARNKGNLPNIQLIADLAGVSKATVSYVLNKKDCVSPETVKLVEETIKRYNYYEVYKARGKKQNNVIGIIVPHNSESFFRKINKAVSVKLNEYNKILNVDFGTVLCFSNEKHSEEVRLAKILKNLNIAGLIIAPTYHDQNYLKSIFGEDFPIVFIDRTPEIYTGEKIVVKTTNNYKITKECVNYLIELGHSKIGFIYGYSSISTAIERRKAYEQALKESRIIVDETLIKEVDTSKKVDIIERVKDGYEAIRTLVERKKITALFCAHNFGTLSAIKYIIDSNKRIPDDISIIGFDDNEWSEALDISAIRQPTEDIAHLAIQELVKKIFPSLEIGTDNSVNSETPATFIKRKSVASIQYPLLINSSDGYVRDEKGNVHGIWDKNKLINVGLK